MKTINLSEIQYSEYRMFIYFFASKFFESDFLDFKNKYCDDSDIKDPLHFYNLYFKDKFSVRYSFKNKEINILKGNDIVISKKIKESDFRDLHTGRVGYSLFDSLLGFGNLDDLNSNDIFIDLNLI